jgi:hypothetical protein
VNRPTNESPYKKLGYGLRWPSSQIVTDVYRHIDLLPEKDACGLDFGCGLGAHGWLMESFPNFTKVIYVDTDLEALERARELRLRGENSIERHFVTDIGMIAQKEAIHLILDRASLQHCKSNQIMNVLTSMRDLLTSNQIQANSRSSVGGLLITEWIYSGSRESQLARFSDITFFPQIEEQISSMFSCLSQRLTTIKSSNPAGEFTIANLVFQPKWAT